MSITDFLVRNAEKKDLPGIVALERSIPEAPHWVEADYKVIVDTPNNGIKRSLFVAEKDGRLIGFAVGKAIGAPAQVAELESVAVSPSIRRSGAGKALCMAIAGWSREQGAAMLELEVRSTSAGAIALYLGLGFVTVGRRAAYYHIPLDDALLMTLKL